MPFIRTKSNVELFYNVVGKGDKTAVLVHGAGATCRMWSLQIRALVNEGYKVVVYDNRGHGATKGTEGLYTIDLFAKDLEELLEALEITEPIYLCGLSMGGMIAQKFVINNPDKVKAVILANTYSCLGHEYLAAAMGMDVETLKTVEITNQYVYDVFMASKPEGWNLADHMMLASQLLLEKSEFGQDLFFDDQVYSPSWEERCKTQGATGSFDCRADLDKIKCPTLVTTSENDMIVPPDLAVYIHEHIPGSQFVVFEGSNHVPCLDNVEVFNRCIIDFFKSVDLTEAKT